MTNHYNIEIKETKTLLKITYRDKKFKKLEHIRGKLDKQMMRQIGRILPQNETDISDFNIEYDGKVDYSIIVQEKSLFSMFNAAWFGFCIDKTGIEPKFTGADGKALNQIIAYLKRINGGNELKALETWQAVLSSFHKLDKFYQDNADLKIINSKLNAIIRQITKTTETHDSGSGGTVGL